jgi:hypothetical protein
MKLNALGKGQMVCNTLQVDDIKYGSVRKSHVEYSPIEKGLVRMQLSWERSVIFR